MPVAINSADTLSAANEVVLLCLVGLSPAVLTETIWALAHDQEAVVPDRVIVCTTSRGAETLKLALFEGGGWARFTRALEAALGRSLCDKLRFGPVAESIRVIPSHARDRELTDIVTTADNQAVGDFLLENLRPFTENDGCQLIGSIAGGRKTMGALLLTVMTLIGRDDDRVCHVLVNDPWDRISEALFPEVGGRFPHPESGEVIASDRMQVTLADIPFVPMRQLFPREIGRFSGSYRGLVNQLRQRASRLEEELSLVLDPLRGLCRFCGKAIDLSAREFLFQLYFARRAAEGLGPLASYADFPKDAIAEMIETYRQPDDFSHWTGDAADWLPQLDPQEDLRKLAQSIRQKALKRGVERLAVSRLVPGRGYLGVELSPEHITINN
jgi:CRISPR-associated protein (TIGR02584 family)